MASNETISRIEFADDPYSFDSLRREGIGYVQQFSGAVWTDYNTHDPGVTILEQLCYGLTDIMYRTDFDVADYLVDSGGKLDIARLALERPQAILPARPNTIEDYHHAILDAVKEVEQVWITPYQRDSKPFEASTGLYQIKLRLTREASDSCQRNAGYGNKIIRKVSHIYGKLRNLSEDLAQVSITEQIGYQLEADIDIEGLSDPVDILANIYFTAMQFLTGKLAVMSYEEQKNAGMRLDQILNGPLLLHGNYQHSQVPKENDDKHIEELYTQLVSINGLSRVNSLKLISSQDGSIVDGEKPVIDSRARLTMPSSEANIFVALKRNGYALNVPYGILNNRFSQREFKQDSMRHTRQDFLNLYPLPAGDYRDLDYYYSIQNHFPATYQLNGLGMSGIENNQQLGQIRQLRGYLVIFEQFMANFGANLQSINQLFSLDCSARQSYHFHLLDNQTIYGVDQIYPPSPQQQFEAVLSQFDHFFDRKGRVLDYLLALYGESLTQQIVSDFNYYDDDHKLRQRILLNKRDFLKSIVTLGKNRGGGFDVSKIVLSKDNISGLQARLNYLLGFTQTTDWPCSKAIAPTGLTVVSDHDFLSQCERGHVVRVNSKSTILERSQDVPLKDIDDKSWPQHSNNILKRFVVLKQGMIGQSFFSSGIDISRYKMVSAHEGQGYALYFRMNAVLATERQKAGASETWVYLGHSHRIKVIIASANLLRRYLSGVNHNSEGMYVVEHLLLRPKDWQGPDMSAPQPDFYRFQMSLIFPAYTARCRDLGYQAQAEIIARENAPAHILPNCLWLEYDQMVEFEQLYISWLECRRLAVEPNEQSYAAAEKLKQWLVLRQP